MAVIGVPYDEGTTSRSGTRMGPRALREASTLWSWIGPGEEVYDGEIGEPLLGGVRFVDCGDVGLAHRWPPEERHGAIIARVQPPSSRRASSPSTLGGDHSVAYPLSPP